MLGKKLTTLTAYRDNMLRVSCRAVAAIKYLFKKNLNTVKNTVAVVLFWVTEWEIWLFKQLWREPVENMMMSKKSRYTSRSVLLRFIRFTLILCVAVNGGISYYKNTVHDRKKLFNFMNELTRVNLWDVYFNLIDSGMSLKLLIAMILYSILIVLLPVLICSLSATND